MARLNTTGRNQPRPSGRDTLHRAFDLAPGQRAAVDQAYAVFLDHHAPFVTAIAARMLQDLRRDVAADPEHRIVFLGRDGHSYAAALRGLDPDFFRDHCTEIVVSRVVVDAALQDLERHTDARFDAVEAFRVRHRVHPHEVDGAFRALTGYLVNSAVPIDRADASVTLIDNSLRGTIQELLAAAYPTTRFTGRYALHIAHPDDPHPGTKHGYALHQPVNHRWRGLPEPTLPHEIELTFACNDALSAIEGTLNGPASSPRTIDAQGPVQQAQRELPDPLRGLNPVLVNPGYRDATVRDAIKTAALLAVHDFASSTGRRWAPDPGTAARQISDAQHAFTLQIRAWIERTPALDPQLGAILDSLVLRDDRALLGRLHDTLAQRGVDEPTATLLFSTINTAPNLEVKTRIATDALARLTPPKPAPRRHPAATANAVLTPPADRSSRGTATAPHPPLHPKPRTSGLSDTRDPGSSPSR